MRTHLLPAVLLLSACSVPFTRSTAEEKAACDRIAAQAIQTKSPQEAKNLAARAADCYARIAQ